VSERPAHGQVLVLTDGSPAGHGAVRLATEIASGLSSPLAVLGVSDSSEDDGRIARAVAAGQAHARPRVSSLETIQATGELMEVVSRRVSESPTSLVVLGASPHGGASPDRLASRVWKIVRMLSPPVLVVPEGNVMLSSFLFCTGGARYIEEGAGFAAEIAVGVGARVTVFHVSPPVPAMYGERLEREEESAEDFLRSNSRLARNIRRQIDIFREKGAPTDFRVSTGDVGNAIERELRRGGHDLVIVGSSPAGGPIRTYMLGNVTRDVLAFAWRPFLVLRSRQPGLWAEVWRILVEPSSS
jgi:nucleotide-binding universal stress UspA family protein